MKRFEYSRADTPKQAATSASPKDAAFIAGGTNLLDLMKYEIETPIKLVDVTRLELEQIEPTADGGLRIGTLVTNSDLAAHPDIVANYPVLSRAILAGATGQLRNKATTGGNFLQRTRCYYFYQTDSPCNKREPGTGCPAINGENRTLAILGTSEACIAQHPSDMAVAMRLLDAKIETVKTDGSTRTIPIKDFYCLPKDTPHIENVLESGELITHVVLPAPIKGIHTYDKVRDRASYAFALVSCAAVIDVDDSGKLTTIRLAFGGIGTEPWRNEKVEALLTDTDGNSDVIRQAADLLLKEAKGNGQNDFKIPLTRRLLKQVIQRALAGEGA
ncbi:MULTISPECIES: FAD binding domain-containing protein [Psychrobacter]|jgi:xanthine dehydrogenase YagS FAD-binding subunit|uniref:FAD binding domain-containing protein n=1 Tax=Psychrobacter TaxID=497 RepID=UPI00257F2122|nr:xanthine dehydrogenase family protein subunit M [Psychrobacter sp. UBA3068]|tara:strand:+ start:145 stop:1137 length:993 start_codon:yes stop_codon:yes gene_type:complete